LRRLGATKKLSRGGAAGKWGTGAFWAC